MSHLVTTHCTCCEPTVRMFKNKGTCYCSMTYCNLLSSSKGILITLNSWRTAPLNVHSLEATFHFSLLVPAALRSISQFSLAFPSCLSVPLSDVCRVIITAKCWKAGRRWKDPGVTKVAASGAAGPSIWHTEVTFTFQKKQMKWTVALSQYLTARLVPPHPF